MKESIRLRLEKLTDRYEEVGRLLADSELAGGECAWDDDTNPSAATHVIATHG